MGGGHSRELNLVLIGVLRSEETPSPLALQGRSCFFFTF